MSGLAVALLACAVAWTALAFGLRHRRSRGPIEPGHQQGQLSAAERRRLYQRLGIDPADLARRRTDA